MDNVAKEPVIKIKDLDVIYFLGKSNEVQALKNVNLEIYPGEFIIFFGPSGCGKSTLLYSIAGLETNIHGNIFIDDKDLSSMKIKEIEEYHRKKMGIIFQAFYLINSLSILNNVILPQIFLSAKYEERKKKAYELLEHFGVRAQAHKLPTELSGGQQQRVAICRSLMNNPELLLADEPVGNLDSKSSDEVMALLGELNEKEKKTVILVTHNPAHLRFAHRVFYMKDGMITDVKVNKEVDRSPEAALERVQEGGEERPSISRELELLLRTYSGLSSAQAGSLLIPFKAKQIVLEVLVGMTTEEIDEIEKKVENLLIRGVDDNNEIMNFLDIDAEKGGMGLDKRTAERLAAKIKDIVTEIEFLEKADVTPPGGEIVDTEVEIVQIRRYLLDEFDAKVANINALKNFDTAIKDRIENKIDRVKFQKNLDIPVLKGGVGFDKRSAKKVAKRMELLILGKYK